jgi:hypothetical protein
MKCRARAYGRTIPKLDFSQPELDFSCPELLFSLGGGRPGRTGVPLGRKSEAYKCTDPKLDFSGPKLDLPARNKLEPASIRLWGTARDVQPCGRMARCTGRMARAFGRTSFEFDFGRPELNFGRPELDFSRGVRTCVRTHGRGIRGAGPGEPELGVYGLGGGVVGENRARIRL